MDQSFGRKFVDLVFRNGQILALLFAFLVIGGIYAFATAKPKGFPEVNINLAIVSVVYPGATANQIEDQVLVPLEQAVSEIKTVSEYGATANDSFGVLTVTFDEASKLEDGMRDLAAKLARVDLPEGAQDPEIADITASAGFSFLVAVTGPEDALELYRKTNSIKEELEAIDGVGKVEVNNPIRPIVSVEFDNAKLAAARLTRSGVEGALKAAQLDVPAGQFVDRDENKISLGITKKISDLNAVRDLIVAPGIRLGDVANVSFVLDNQEHYNRIGFATADNLEDVQDGARLTVKRSLLLAVSLDKDAEILGVADRLKEKEEELVREEEYENVQLLTLFSEADATEDQVKEIQAGLIGENIEQWGPLGFLGYLFGGIALVVLLLLIFVNWRVAILAALSIPLSLAVGALYLNLIGVEMNTLVLFSMVLVIGLVVDPTIVFLEAMQRYRQQGLAPKEAAVKTINSVGMGVALAAVTNFLVFVPFGVVSGFFGQIIRYIPITVIPAIIASFVVPVIFFMPVAAFWLKAKKTNEALEEEQELVGAWAFSKWLGKVETNILKPGKAWLRVLIIILAVALPIVVAGALTSSGAIRFVQFSSQEDGTEIFVTGNVNPAWTFERAVRSVVPVQDYLAQQPEIKNFSYYQQNGNSFTLLVSLWPMLDRQMEEMRTANELAADLNAHFATIGDIQLSAVSATTGPPEEAYPVKVQMFGEDIDKLQIAANNVRQYLTDHEGVKKVEDSLTGSMPTMPGTALVLDSANPANLNPFIAVGTIQEELAERDVVDYEVGGETWTVVTSVNTSVDSLDSVKNIGLGGLPVPTVGSLITGAEEQEAENIQRLNGRRYVEVKAQVKDGEDPILIQADLNKYLNEDKLKELGLDENATASKGESDAIAKSFTDLFVALIIALFLIYLLLVSFFSSLVAPLIIMFAIPLGLAGVLPAVAIATGQLGFLELLGVVAMAGIVVNVTILIIDFANQLMKQGKSAQEAIATSVAVRYKAIFLTKLTILAGLMPLAIFSPFWRGLAVAMIFGIIVSAILSLFTTPILYVWSKTPMRRRKRAVVAPAAMQEMPPIVMSTQPAQAPVQPPGQFQAEAQQPSIQEQIAPTPPVAENTANPSEAEIRELLNKIIRGE